MNFNRCAFVPRYRINQLYGPSKFLWSSDIHIVAIDVSNHDGNADSDYA